VQDFFQQHHWHLMDDVEVRFEATALSLLPMAFDSTTQARLISKVVLSFPQPSKLRNIKLLVVA